MPKQARQSLPEPPDRCQAPHHLGAADRQLLEGGGDPDQGGGCQARVRRAWAKNEDVANALRGQRAFDEDELLEHIPPQTIRDAVTRDWLAKAGGAPFYYVTRKAVLDLDLPRTVGGRKIQFLDRGL